MVRPHTPLPWKAVEHPPGHVEVQNADTGVTVCVMDADNARRSVNMQDAQAIVAAMHFANKDQPAPAGPGRPYRFGVLKGDHSVQRVVSADLDAAVDEVMSVENGETLYGHYPEPSQGAIGRHVELWARKHGEEKVRHLVREFLRPYYEEMAAVGTSALPPDRGRLVFVVAHLPFEDTLCMMLRGHMSNTERLRTIIRYCNNGELPEGYPDREAVRAQSYVIIEYAAVVPVEMPGAEVLQLHPADSDAATGDDKLTDFPWGDVLDGTHPGECDEDDESGEDEEDA